MEADLISLGLRLRWVGDGTDRVSWRDLWIIIHNSKPGSAVGLYVHGESSMWGISEYLQAAILDALNGANYQRSGGKGQKPKPVPRPSDHAQRPTLESVSEDPSGKQVFAKDGFEPDAVSITEIDEWLGRKPAAA